MNVNIKKTHKVVKIEVKENLKKAIQKGVEPFGGIEQFVNQGDEILLKPNFNTGHPYPGSTDVKFLKAVTRLVDECQPQKVIIGDSPSLLRPGKWSVQKVLDHIGVFSLEEMDNPPQIDTFREGNWIKKKVPDSTYLKEVWLPESLENCDKLILLPCLKTHSRAQFTGSLKLSVGFMKLPQRISLHRAHLQEKIAELSKVIKPDLIIMDARKCFITGGPSRGEIREPGLILASTDRIAIDLEGIKIIQGYKGNSLQNVKPEELVQIKKAKELGLDSMNG